MDLEPHTIESLGDRCEVCGAKLSREEQAEVLERGHGPLLCAVHADELQPAEELSDPDD